MGEKIDNNFKITRNKNLPSNSDLKLSTEGTLNQNSLLFSQIHPLVTVVTVVYNGEASIEKTITSVINQNYYNIEYIIIDGGSTDGTVDIIKKYDYAIDRWISERDNGIYDAMNKGIDIATGDWINFMNCGDTFIDVETIRSVVANIESNIDLIYGDYCIKNGTNLKHKKNGRESDLWRGLFCHQAMFIKTPIAKQSKFDVSIPINADSDMVLKFITRGLSYRKLNCPLACIESGGLSDENRLRSVLTQWNLTLRYKPRNPLIINIYFFALFGKNLILTILRGFRFLHR